MRAGDGSSTHAMPQTLEIKSHEEKRLQQDKNCPLAQLIGSQNQKSCLRHWKWRSHEMSKAWPVGWLVGYY